MAYTLYRVASPEGDQIISRRALQETLVAYVASAGEPGRQEGAQDVDRALTQAEVPPRALPRGILLGVGQVPQAVRKPARFPPRLAVLRPAASTIRRGQPVDNCPEGIRQASTPVPWLPGAGTVGLHPVTAGHQPCLWRPPCCHDSRPRQWQWPPSWRPYCGVRGQPRA